MKKLLTLLALASLLFAGCSKSDMQQQSSSKDGIDVLETVTFTAVVPDQSATQTKAFTPKDDGHGESADRCIMELYYNNKFYKRDVKALDANKKATFSLQVPANRTYDVLFWADKAGDGGIGSDLYYKTDSDDGLKNIFIIGPYAGNDDARDAFFYYESCPIVQGGSTFDFTLKRPFAQINVITTDVEAFKTAVDAIPDEVDVTLKLPYTSFNVMTGNPSGQVEQINYTADLYEFPGEGEFEGVTQAKLSMDYVFASKGDEAGTMDIIWKAKKTSNADIVHDFTNIPFKRNYRTNIKGDLLTSSGNWNVTVDPSWKSDEPGEEEILYEVVNDIAGANQVIDDAIEDGQSEINVKFTSQPNDAGTPGSSESGSDIVNKAIVTTNLPEDSKLNILVEAQTKDLYIGDFETATSTTVVTDQQIVSPAVVNVNIPVTSGVQKLVINAPSKTVYVNGIQVASTGVIDNLDAITSNNTLVIEKGQVINHLTIRKGALKIFGQVNEAEVIPENGQSQVVFVRDCENLSQEVFEVLEGYIDRPAYSEKADSDGTWNIVPSVCFIGTDKGFATLAQAIAEVGEGETITFAADETDAAGIAVNTQKTFTVDFAGHTYTVNKPGAGSQGTQTMAFQLLAGQNITFKNGTIQASEENLTEATAPAKNIKRMFQGYSNVTFQNVTIDGTNLYGNNSVTEFACGTVSIEGSSTIKAKEGVKAINVDTWKDYYPAGTAVTINTTGKIGDVYLYSEGDADQYTKSSIALNAGKIASVTTDESGEYTVAIENGTFFKVAPAQSFLRVDQEVTTSTTEPEYIYEVVARAPIAKIGTVQYYTLEDALANWANNTTLTLLKDIAVNSTIKIKSTEMHTLDLSTFTITANGCDAIMVENYGRTSASYAFDIKADATNPGGIVAASGACIRTDKNSGTAGSKDRPIIRIYSGVYNGMYCIQHANSNGTNCPQYYIYGGDFTSSQGLYSIFTNRALLQIFGGVFHNRLHYSVDQNAYAVIGGGKFITVENLFGPDYNQNLRGTLSAYINKLTYGSAKRTVTDPSDVSAYDRDVTVDEEGYYCVTPIIDNKEGQFEAALSYTPQPVTSYGEPLDFSRVGIDKKLFYADADMAIQQSKDKIYLYSATSADKTVNVDNFEMDATAANAAYTGTVTITKTGGTFKYVVLSGKPALENVYDKDGNKITPTSLEEDGKVTYSYLYGE